MASERPEYHSKIRSQISLAPAAYLTNMKSPIQFLFRFAKFYNVSMINEQGLIILKLTISMILINYSQDCKENVLIIFPIRYLY